jgi:hypothetical protein
MNKRKLILNVMLLMQAYLIQFMNTACTAEKVELVNSGA